YRINAGNLELQVAPRGEHRHLTEKHDLHSVIGWGPHPVLVAERHDTTNLCIAIAQVEIPVPVAMPLEVADLATNPQIPEACLYDLACLESEIAHRQRVVGRAASRTRGAAGLNVREIKRQRLL